MSLHRRSFLAALGAFLVEGAAGAQMKQDSTARPGISPRTGRPLRFFGVYAPHGCAYEYYLPKDDFDFSYAHASLGGFENLDAKGQPLKSHLTLIDGVDLSAGLEAGTVGHDAPRVILTGSAAKTRHPSIDQYLAVQRGLGAATIYTSLVCGVGNDRSGIEDNISYAQGGTPVAKCIDPQQLYDELFGVPLSGQSSAALQQQRALGKSALDFVRSDLRRLTRNTPSDDRSKLEQHQQAVRDIEKQLNHVRPVCTPPERPLKYEQLRAYGGGEPNFGAVTEIMIDLNVRALACDLTRFSTLWLADLSRTKTYPDYPSDVHQHVAHLYRARDDRGGGDPKSWQALAVQNRYSYDAVARLASRLSEADILDDSVVYASSDMGDPAKHSSRHVPSFLVGSAGGAWNTGRVLSFAKDGHIPNNRILVSICRAFGVETDRFGEAAASEVVSGAVQGLADATPT